MAEGDVVVSPDAISVKVTIPKPRIIIRNYFSTHLLWAARDFAAKAGEIEKVPGDGGSRFDIEQRAFVLGSVFSAVSFLEAMVNELFQDAHDGHVTHGAGSIDLLSARTRERMAEWWAESDQGFERTLAKYQCLLAFADQPKLNMGAEPYQSAKLLIRLRNALIHYRSESVAADVKHPFTESLKGRFPDNALLEGSGNPWWPDHALGAGCAQWAFESARAFTDTVTDTIQIKPNYRQHAETWFKDS